MLEQHGVGAVCIRSHTSVGVLAVFILVLEILPISQKRIEVRNAFLVIMDKSGTKPFRP